MRRQDRKMREPDPTHGHVLSGELQDVLKEVGPHNYGRATARQFAPGGDYNPKPKRRRYAIT